MLFGIFGIAPVVTRTNDILPLMRNILGLIGSGIGDYLIAERKFKDPNLNKQS
jgi:hypothetical protein